MVDEESDVFEITDFTTASDWERFIAQLEEVIHEWKLVSSSHPPPLKKGELTSGEWEEVSKTLNFSNFPFSINYYKFKQDDVGEEIEIQSDEDNKDLIPLPVQDMMLTDNDFPARAHCLCRWYGLREFLIIHPGSQQESINQESRLKILLSSVSMAMTNAGCSTPTFVQFGNRSRKLYQGLCESPGIRTSFEMIHLQRVPRQYHHLRGLIDLFKAKLASPVAPLPPVSVSVRFTFVLQDWTYSHWSQEPPDFDLDLSIGCKHFGQLPFGALEDPVSDLQLYTTWPALNEEIVVDDEGFTDLDPLQAPYWSVRVRMAEDPQLLLSEYIEEFFYLCNTLDTTEDLLGQHYVEDDADSAGDYSQALQRLTEPGPSYIPKLSAVMSKARSKMPMKPEEAPIPADRLNEILLHLFPDAQDLDFENQDWAYKEPDNITEDIKETVKKFKATPIGSLTEKVAVILVLANLNLGGLKAVAHLWQEFALELRYRWENSIFVPGLDAGSPNLASCLIHQKLQMLNCCIERKRKRENSKAEFEGVGSFDSDSSSADDRKETHNSTTAVGEANKEVLSIEKVGSVSSLTSDDEFYECEDEENVMPMEIDVKPDVKKENQGSENPTDDGDDAKTPVAAMEIEESLVSKGLVKTESLEAADGDNVAVKTESKGDTGNNSDAKESRSDSVSSSKSFQDSITHRPEGRLKKFGEHKLLHSTESLYIPVTQEPPPVTEDILDEQANALTKLGTSAEGSHMRARMQCASLLSDMEAFKAANPGCVLEDFVRWYSPRDYIEEETIEEDGTKSKKGFLSPRMQIAGNMWFEVWQTSEAVPVTRQKRLFDDTKEAEKILHYLTSMKPADVAKSFLPMIVSKAVQHVKENDDGTCPSLEPLLDQIITKVAKYTRAPVPLQKYEDIFKSIRLAETVIARCRSLKAKFTAHKTKDKDELEELDDFVSSILKSPEIAIRGGPHGPAGRIIHNLFMSAQRASSMAMEDDVENSTPANKLTIPDFPEPAAKEYILRTAVSRPAPYSRPTPQRMFCVLLKDEYRFAGAFSTDTTFM